MHGVTVFESQNKTKIVVKKAKKRLIGVQEEKNKTKTLLFSTLTEKVVSQAGITCIGVDNIK